MKNSELITPILWSVGGGVLAGMALLSYGFGYMAPSAADKLASAKAEKAVVAVLAPACAEKFRALSDAVERTVALRANTDNAWKQRETFPEALITLPGESYKNPDLATACAALVLTPAKAVEVKQ
jgi:hypothetical protein